MGVRAPGAVFLGDAARRRLGRGCARRRSPSGRAASSLLGVGVPEHVSARADSFTHVRVGHSDPRRAAFERRADGEPVGHGCDDRSDRAALFGPRRPGS